MTEFFLVLMFQYVSPFVVAILVLLLNRRPMPIRFIFAMVAGLAFFVTLSAGGSRWLWIQIHSENTSQLAGSTEYWPPTLPPYR